MTHIQIGLLMLLGISAFGVITLYLDFWRAAKAQRDNKEGHADRSPSPEGERMLRRIKP